MQPLPVFSHAVLDWWELDSFPPKINWKEKIAFGALFISPLTTLLGWKCAEGPGLTGTKGIMKEARGQNPGLQPFVSDWPHAGL